MPLLQVITNLPKDKITKEFNLHLSDFFAKLFEKPKEFTAVHILPDQNLSFGGTFEPYAYVNLISIGKLGVEENKRHSKELMTEFEKIGIPAHRVFIYFQEPQPFQIGFNKTTFEELSKTSK